MHVTKYRFLFGLIAHEFENRLYKFFIDIQLQFYMRAKSKFEVHIREEAHICSELRWKNFILFKF